MISFKEKTSLVSSICKILITILINFVPLKGQNNEELLFSHQHGIYSEPFTLTISSDIREAKIRYTLDGSNPLTSQSAFVQDSSVSITIDPTITTNRDKAPGYIVTACATFSDTLVSKIITQTYLFVNKIIELSPDNQVPGPGWLVPGSNVQQISYGLDPQVYNDARYQPQMITAFTSIPTLSLVTDLKNLFNPDSGIYVNAFYHGDEWERSASLELIIPDGGKGFQINCGVRIRGGWSRHPEDPIHAFRILFN